MEPQQGASTDAADQLAGGGAAGDLLRELPAQAIAAAAPHSLPPIPPELRDLLAAALSSAAEAVTITVADLDEPRIVFVNTAFTELTGYAAAEVVGRTPRLLQGPKTDRRVLDELRAGLAAGRGWGGEAINYRKDGSELWLEWRIAPVRDAAGRVAWFVATQRDITARRLTWEAAERSSLAKTHFLARMSHELLTPLNSLIGFPQMLIDGHFGPLDERQGQAVANVLEAAEQLRHLIQDLLDLARLDAGRLQMEIEVFDLGALLADLAGPLAATASRKRIAFCVEIAPDLPRLAGDPARLKQAFVNLLDNALKYTPTGGNIALRARPQATLAGPPWLHIEVADSGMGIQRDDFERIFHLFEQVDPSLSRRHPGTGLGLALVIRIVDLHGGRVWVESAGEGQGSTFHVELPGHGEPRP
jgi:PAS domain S-box-containing protein